MASRADARPDTVPCPQPATPESRPAPTAPTAPTGGVGRPRLLAGTLLALAATIAAASVSGPLWLELMRYRTSDTTLNQLLGSDAAALYVVVPLTVAAAVLAARRHRAAPVLATGIGAYALYTYTQIIIGQEYLRLPGNVERFFPLLLAIFLLAEAVMVLAWRAVPDDLPPLPPRLARVTGAVLLVMAVFLTFGQHLRPLLIAWQDPASLNEYASSPTPFWMVKLMDLGIIVPAAVVTGIGVLRRAPWAQRVAYLLLTAYACLSTSVAAMALVMLAHDDPDASPAIAGGFVFFALAFVSLAVSLYRPLFRPASTLSGDK